MRTLTRLEYVITTCFNSHLLILSSLRTTNANLNVSITLSINKFFGNWIEVEKTPSIFDLMMRCLVVDYSDDQDNTVNVVVRGVSLAGLPLTVNGDGLLQDVHRAGFYSIR